MTRLPLLRTAQWHWRETAGAMALAFAALMLASCGGVAPEEPVVTSPTSPASGANPSVPVTDIVAAHPATQLSGLYAYTDVANHVEYLSLAIPPANSNSDTEWFAWHRQTAGGYPWLYHGFFALSVDGNAKSSSVGVTQAKGNISPSSVSITLTQASKTSFTASVTDNNVSNPTTSSYKAQAQQTSFNFANSALTNDLSADWTGTWFDSGSTFGSSTLHFSANGVMNGIVLGTCTLDLILQPAARWNYFVAGATLNPQSGCVWTLDSNSRPQIKVLQGIAVIQPSVNGHAQLDMMLLDGKGAGISYRGTR